MTYLKLITGSLVLATAMQAAPAFAGDPVVGGLIGGAAGAAIGNHVHGRHGAIVGAAIGGATGVLIATEPRHRRYDEPRTVVQERVVVRETPRYYYREPVRYAEPVYYHPRPQPIVYVRETRHRHHHHGWHRGWDRRDERRDHRWERREERREHRRHDRRIAD